MTTLNFARSRKTLIATGLALVLTAGATGAFAWGGGDRGRAEPAQRFEYIFDELNLTDDQQQQVLDVMKTFGEEQRAKMEARRESGAGRPTEDERDALREAAHQSLVDELGTVLQPTQVEELVKYLEFHRGMMGGGPRHHGGDHGRWQDDDRQGPPPAPEADNGE